MMGSYHLLVAAVLLLVVAVHEGVTLECVECNSFARPDCDTNPLSYKTSCPTNATSCRKMEQEVYYDDDFHVRTVRQCAMESGPLKCVERTGTYRFKVYYCHCEGDNCNSAGTLSISLVLTALCGALVYMFKL